MRSEWFPDVVLRLLTGRDLFASLLSTRRRDSAKMTWLSRRFFYELESKGMANQALLLNPVMQALTVRPRCFAACSKCTMKTEPRLGGSPGLPELTHANILFSFPFSVVCIVAIAFLLVAAPPKQHRQGTPVRAPWKTTLATHGTAAELQEVPLPRHQPYPCRRIYSDACHSK